MSRRWAPDAIAIAVLAALVAVVHNVASMLSQPYWLDETWVALSVRARFGDLWTVTSSTPIGWTLLLRLLPAQELRLLTLAFQALTVIAAYALGRLLAWPTTTQARLAGSAGAAAVLLLPAQQVRNDLKQYTADAAAALALLALTAWAESGWSRRRLGVLVAAVPVGLLVSNVTAIAAAGAFGGLILSAAVRRQWRRCAEATVAGAIAAVGLVVGYVTISTRNRNEALVNYWAAYFPAPGTLIDYVGHRLDELRPFIGLPVVLLALVIGCGLVTIGRRGGGAVVIAVASLPVSCIVLGLAHSYPLLDLRTSHFLLVVMAAVGGIGLVGAATWVTAGVRQRLSGRSREAVAIGLVALAIAGFGRANADWYRFDGRSSAVAWVSPMATEDVRSATTYVRDHRAANDVILLSLQARYGVAFYWNDAPLRPVAYPNSVGWVPELPSDATFVVAPGATTEAIRAGVAEAELLARRTGGRIWLIRTHWTGEVAGWQSALAGLDARTVTDGVEPVLLLSPPTRTLA